MQEQIGAILFRWRNILFPVIFTLLLAFAPPSGPHATETKNLLFWCGLTLAACGASIRLLVASTHYVKRAGRNGSVHADELFVGGPFAVTRNPLYVGNVLIATGFLVLLGNLSALAVGVPVTILTYQSIISTEESYLRIRFGQQYENYIRTVPRWLPDLTRWQASFLNAGFCWRRAIAMDYSTTGAVIAGITIMAIRGDITSGTHVPATLWAMLASTLVAIVFVRHLKKSGRLLTQ